MCIHIYAYIYDVLNVHPSTVPKRAPNLLAVHRAWEVVHNANTYSFLIGKYYIEQSCTVLRLNSVNMLFFDHKNAL